MKLAIIFEAKELEALQPGVVVESWRRVMSTGTGKRKLAAAFTADEIEKVKKVYKLYCWWYGKMMPSEHRCTIAEYEFMQRVTYFFGTYE